MLSFEFSNTQKLVLLVSLPVSGVLLYLLLKNNEEEEELSSAPKLTTTRSTVIEVRVPHYAVGAIIGAKGANIKQIQEESGARVNMKDSEARAEMRTVIVRGTSEQAQRAEYLIHKIVQDVPQKVEEKIYVPVQAVGRIIGKRGQTIHEMSSISKAKITVERADPRNTSETRLVTIVGVPEAIANAKELIQEKLDEEKAQQAKLALSAANRPQRHYNRHHQSQGSGDARQTAQRKTSQPTKPSQPTYGPPMEDDEDSSEEESFQFAAAISNAHKPANTGMQQINNEIKLWEQTEKQTVNTSYWPSGSEYVDVYVTSVASPSNFWVQIVNSESVQLDSLNEKLNSLCNTQAKNHHPTWQVNDMVGAMHAEDGSWYRARIMQVLDDGKVDLYFVDYGDSAYGDATELVPLSSQYQELPHQAHECSIDGIEPAGGSDAWGDKVAELFEEITYLGKWKVLVAQSVGRHNDIRSIKLVDTNSPQDINIAAELVKRGVARWRQSNHSAASETTLPSQNDQSEVTEVSS